jgi:Uma2 family endonuclease
MLTLPRRLTLTATLTPAQFAEVCAANPEAVLELDADGHLVEMSPTGSSTSVRHSRLISQLQQWADRFDGWLVFDSSGGFQLPDGSVRSPDASVVRLERWRALSEEERDGFAPLCPDLVVELASTSGASPSDPPEALRRKLGSYMANGARLGWLLLPQARSVEVWEAGSGEPRVLGDPARLEAGPAFPGLVIDLQRIWEV